MEARPTTGYVRCWVKGSLDRGRRSRYGDGRTGKGHSRLGAGNRFTISPKSHAWPEALTEAAYVV